MKRIALLAALGAGLLALPSTAAAQSATTCPGPVYVNPGPPPYACVDVAGIGGEVVINDSNRCSYVSGWSTPGYAGICTGATSRGPTCSTTGNGGANTGGCFRINVAPAAVNQALNTFPVGLVTASLICGNPGSDPRNTPRDGCAIP